MSEYDGDAISESEWFHAENYTDEELPLNIPPTKSAISHFVRSWMLTWEHYMPTAAFEELDLWLKRNYEQCTCGKLATIFINRCDDCDSARSWD